MWILFYITALSMLLLLVVPSYLLLRGIGFERLISFCCAPLVGTSLIALQCELYTIVGISCTPLAVMAPQFLLCALIAFIGIRRGKGESASRESASPLYIVATLALGALLGKTLLIERLGTPDALFQAYDVMQHLGVIQAMNDSGRLSSMGVGLYLSAADQAIAPNVSSSFYPAAWHAICSLASRITSVSVPVAINASMFTFGCLVYPLSMFAFLHEAYEAKPQELRAGVVVSLAFVSFPWCLLIFGPVYPNVAGFSIMPAAMALFVRATSPSLTKSQRIATFCILGFSCFGLALMHPNTIFSCVLLLFPLAVSRLWNSSALPFLQDKVRKALACVAFTVFCVCFWLFCYHLPALQDITQHVWPEFARPVQEVVNILTQTYTMGFFSEMATQYVIAALVIFGAIKLLYTPGKRWMAFSYLLACNACYAAATRSDELKQVIAGFWYTDHMRLAALASIAAVPLATAGLAWAIDVVTDLAQRYNQSRKQASHPALVTGVILAGVLVVNFIPSFNLPGQHHSATTEEMAYNSAVNPADWLKSFHTTFGDYRLIAEQIYAGDLPLSPTEKKALNAMREVVGDSLVINDPMDGSFLAYGFNGTRVYYRSFLVNHSTETTDSALIRQYLADYATNQEVQDAVVSIGAEYVMVLDQTDSAISFINLRGDYNTTEFAGITAITEETPGFSLVYAQGPCRLYRIDGV